MTAGADLSRVQLLWTEIGSGSEGVLPLRGAGREPLVLAFEVEAPVFIEVTVADDGAEAAEAEDSFGAVQGVLRYVRVSASSSGHSPDDRINRGENLNQSFRVAPHEGA